MNSPLSSCQRPRRLNTGNTIAIAAPAGPADEAVLHQTIAAIEAKGFSVHIPEGIFSRAGYLAGSDIHRARMLNRLFSDPAVDAVFCARGGFGSMRLLPHLDFDLIRVHPKIFVGFSDISVLLSVFAEHCGIVTFHGPVLGTLVSADRHTWEPLWQALTCDHPLVVPAEKPVALRAGSASGIVSGGNLSTLCHLTGTAFAPRFRNRLLFLEDVGEPAYKIDRMLTQMKLSGALDGVAGILLGSFDDCCPAGELHRIVADIFQEKPIPILAGFTIGHGKRNHTLPLGMNATLDTAAGHLRYDEPPTIV